MNLLQDILNNVPTPFYLYNQDILDRQIKRLRQQKPDNLKIYYAMKGNSNIHILKYFKTKGLGTEIASGGELYLAKQAGFKGKDIIFTGPGKTNKELGEAVDFGIKTIHVESLNEAIRLDKICEEAKRTQPILLRINAKFEVKTKVQLSGIASPFGISEEDIYEVLPEILKLKNLNFQGIHVYNASGILDYNLLLQNIKNVFKLVQQLEANLQINIPLIDFGGGLGIDYSDNNEHVDIEAFYDGMKRLIKEFEFENRKLIMEIARFLVAESGTYINRVIDKKQSRGVNFLITDGGIQHFMRTALFGENHSADLVQMKPNAKKEKVNVTGSLCTSIDVLLKEVELPLAEPGDFLLIKKAGCYSLNAGMNHFLSHEMPAEIMITGNTYKYIRKRGKYEDLLINQN